jgi:regulator-associated protein of mTOR
LLGACEAHQILPQNPELPADLFTACLTTPIKIALHWYTTPYNICSLVLSLSLAASLRVLCAAALRRRPVRPSPERRFASRSRLTEISADMIDRIPGRLDNRKTLLGELNWHAQPAHTSRCARVGCGTLGGRIAHSGR